MRPGDVFRVISKVSRRRMKREGAAAQMTPMGVELGLVLTGGGGILSSGTNQAETKEEESW